jgi:hypothetical protein
VLSEIEKVNREYPAKVAEQRRRDQEPRDANVIPREKNRENMRRETDRANEEKRKKTLASISNESEVSLSLVTVTELLKFILLALNNTAENILHISDLLLTDEPTWRKIMVNMCKISNFGAAQASSVYSENIYEPLQKYCNEIFTETPNAALPTLTTTLISFLQVTELRNHCAKLLLRTARAWWNHPISESGGTIYGIFIIGTLNKLCDVDKNWAKDLAKDRVNVRKILKNTFELIFGFEVKTGGAASMHGGSIILDFLSKLCVNDGASLEEMQNLIFTHIQEQKLGYMLNPNVGIRNHKEQLEVSISARVRVWRNLKQFFKYEVRESVIEFVCGIFKLWTSLSTGQNLMIIQHARKLFKFNYLLTLGHWISNELEIRLRKAGPYFVDLLRVLYIDCDRRVTDALKLPARMFTPLHSLQYRGLTETAPRYVCIRVHMYFSVYICVYIHTFSYVSRWMHVCILTEYLYTID